MHSARYMGKGAIVVSEYDPRPPDPGEVHINVAYTGICGTDLHILHGAMDHRVTLGSSIGHEMSGRIARLGDGVEGWTVGQPVTVMPLRSCGSCPACRAGFDHICHRLNFLGIDSAGSMQNVWTVPADLVVALPPGIAMQRAALVEPTAVAVHDVRRAHLRGGEHVMIIGGGPIGVLIALVARSAGAQIMVAEPNPRRRSLAGELGFTVIDPTTTDVPAVVADWTAGAGADVAFEVSGAADGVKAAVDVLSTRGRLVLVAIHDKPRQLDLFRFFWRELTLVGARVYTRDDFVAAVDLVSKEAAVEKLISEVVPLADAMRAFERLAQGDGAMKVLIDCEETTS